MTERKSTMNHAILKLNCTTLAVPASFLVLLTSGVQAGETCPVNANGPDICVSKEGAAPQENP